MTFKSISLSFAAFLALAWGQLSGVQAAEIDKYAFSGSLNGSATAPALTEGSDIIIYVRETAKRIEIDGKLDDEAWEQAIPYNQYFFQQEPLDRAPSSEKTEIRVLQDEHNIYFGVQCYESDPSKIFATVKRRDGSFLRDDALELLIDTFQDKRNSYAFGTNPFGVKVDAIISDEGNHINKSWDCIWYCQSAKNDSGWAVEMAIPFKSLKYKKGELVDWGLNITREIKHRKEVTYLVPIPRGLGHNGKFKGSLFASLKNIKIPSPALNIELQPYLTTGRTRFYEPRKTENNLDGGLDIRYHVTPQLAFDLTYKTDFAQAESEQEIANLTRFNVSLPEKREFFLESAGLFNFGSGTSAGGTLIGVNSGQDEFKLFESRTIGIEQGRRIPLLGGAKIAGRIGKYSLGMMNLQSERSALDDTTTVQSTNFTAIKLKRDLFTNSNIGLMILNKQSSSGVYSRAIGSDAFFAFTPEFIVNGSLAKSFSPDQGSKNRWAGDVGAILNKDWIDMSLRYTQVDSLFNPEMGFVRRGNIRSTEGTVSLTKWLNNDYFKSISAINDFEYKTDHHNIVVDRQHRVNFEFTLASEDQLTYGLHREYEYLPSEDYIREIKIDPGGYHGYHHYIRFTSYQARRLAGGISYTRGKKLDGTTSTLSFSNKTKISNNFNLDLEYKHERLELTHGSITANVLAARGTYSFSTELFAKCYVQWNDADHRVSTNLLLDYIYKPRCHFYLVYNENRDTSIPGTSEVRERIFLLKCTYLWSL